ncbi:biotin carboxyl carrier protein [Alicyclobacillus sacchari]|uniref:Biotin carboxyl carrier protein of acetyl-CoA carboxylase n=1 Tax=Alicyclobacillus sacchari TaxID=392010 RepID=A0A4R8LL56_9BACL|nr:biotin carboxyl carrier protein [Alicyclobacillus sacchari]
MDRGENTLLKLEDIHELIRLLDESSLSEIHIEFEDGKLQLKKATPEAVAYMPVQTTPGIAASVSPQTAPVAVQTANAPAQVLNDIDVHVITSPMVGTFYRAPSPESAPFVEVGAQVTSKTVVCIIEAMKLMNEIEAEVSGEVIEVLAENGQLVEYGQPLFKVRRA